ncbi:MAG TPA: thiamine-phosphate kinase [Cerasibacillus sp.]|uniref:thiamine-phosphate kinase n=1 Tax=Cerasibacillus sp. TaxID=2498711 RepID=UPI002F4101BD
MEEVRQMDEFSFIKAIQPDYYKQSSLIKGIGDDAAVIRHGINDIVTAVDTFVDGVHFSRKTMDPIHIGYRVLAANVSDLAAMGAKPAFYLVAIVIPAAWSDSELLDIIKGMKQLAEPFKVDLIGGDTVQGDQLMISITVIGYVSKEKARYRHTSVPGDVVFVTGTLGDSQAGLHILTHPSRYKQEEYFIRRHRMPTPRIEFVQELQDLKRLTLNDISDGIANEATEIADASDVSIHLFDEHIPTVPSFQQFPKTLQHQWKYFGGEDFELIGTVAESEWETVMKAAKQTDTPIKKVGYVTLKSKTNQSPVMLHKERKEIPLEKKGYIHLK